MFLKKLILHGFKSFADRTEFEFDRGRTSIVGPNGCGKSNVLDSVRWVLGEQSAKTLRGHKMLDVVFAGSRSRQPANFAEVELVFDNSAGLLPTDEQEVAVGRVLYRNGESDYRLNGKPCRLKDVRDLFLDTGVGVDAYSVIEQGKVDALLQANPIERREIFEEAAGISRYKLRRTEAARKLERTQNNLLRLNDLIEELERRLRSVKLAAGKARNYLEYDAKLREQRSAFSLAEFHELDASSGELRQRFEALRDVLHAKRADLAQRDADAAELDHELQAQDERIQALESELAVAQQEASALAERAAQGRRRIDELSALRERQIQYADQTARRATELEERVAAEEAGLCELIAAEQRDAGRVSAIQSDRNDAAGRSGSARQALESEKRAIFEVARQSTRLNNEHANLEQQQRRLEAQSAGLVERRHQLESQAAELALRQAALEARAMETEARAAILSEELVVAEAQLESLAREHQRMGKEIGETKELRGATLARLKLLEDMEARREGIDQGTRGVLDWRDSLAEAGAPRNGSVVGLVADLLSIDDPRLPLLQGVLSRFENQIVIRDAHAFLAEANRRGALPGPVGLIALDRLESTAFPAPYSDAPGFVANAIDWVHCADEYRALAQRLLGRVVVVDVLERALALASAAPEGFVFVTSAGEIVEPGGRIALGAQSSVGGLISRKAEIRQLRNELDEIELRLERSTRERSAVEQQQSDTRLQRDARRDELSEAQRRSSAARTEHVRAQDEMQRAHREQNALESEVAHLSQILADVLERAARVASDRSASESAQRGHESAVGDLERELHALESVVAQLSADLVAAQVENGRTSERRAAREHSLSDLRQRVQTIRAEHTQAEQEAASAAQRIELAEAERATAESRHAALSNDCLSREAAVLSEREARQALRRRIESCGATVRMLHAEIDEVDQSAHQADVALKEIAVRKENLVARVAEELSLDLVALYETYEHSERDWDAVRNEIEELRGRIARLGNVNLDAIQELEELQPRFDNMVAQRGDLVDSIQRLESLIAELDLESKARFAKAFEDIRTHFQELFRKLFGGGKADIILENPDAPLECGIDIIARPPGKEPQSITLLSGGEKTMTAVALLFAVFRSKPSPFTILDEVDAALDESNVGRFNAIVDEFLEHSQFVVITHHKRTMQAADVLYGVTMEEPGVSKRVAVRFDEVLV